MTLGNPATELRLPPRPPAFFELIAEHVAAEALGQLSTGWRLADGQHSWVYRAQNFVVGVTWLSRDEVLEQPAVPDEHLLVVLDGSSVEVSSAGEKPITVSGPSLVVVPAGDSRVVGRESGFMLRVFTSYASAILQQAGNGAAYATPNAAVTGLPELPSELTPGPVRVYPMSEVPDDPERFGRIFRTQSLMINWFKPQTGSRDPDQMTPHSHDDFEQASVTLAGEYVHHIRRPWTARLRDWRPDEHVQVNSPSVTIIPPGNIHTTRAVGEGVHHLIDIFAPPREDFINHGWVINQSEYEDNDPPRTLPDA